MTDDRETDARLLAACASAKVASDAYDAAVDCARGDEPTLVELLRIERATLARVELIPARTVEGLLAKTAILARWRDHYDGAALAFSLAKDAIDIGRRMTGVR